MPRISTIALALLLTGCTAQSQVQARYDGNKSECQSRAASSVSTMSAERRDRASAIKTEFANCMMSKGWKLSTGQKEVAVSNPAPIWTPSGPGVNPVTASAPASTAARTSSVGTSTATSATAAPGSPATLSMPQPTSTVPPGASTYQPAVQPGRYFGPR